MTGVQTCALPICTLTATIPNASAYTTGVSPNTIYVGWSPASKITYTASVSGGQPPYSYKWTTTAGLNIVGLSTQQTVQVTSTTVGTYTLTLKVTDAYGCQVTATKTITVVDVRCGNKLDKVALCKIQPAGTICINAGDVASQLANGNAILGPCPIAPVTRIESDPIKVPVVTSSEVTINPAIKPGILNSESFKVFVSPNPSASDFTIRVQSNSNELINIRVTDALGRVITTITGVQKNSLIILSKYYRGGNYFAEVVQGANHKIVKLIKLN